MFEIIYLSQARWAMTHDQLTDILVKARARNAQATITGMLMYQRGLFLQVLEGPEAAVRSTFSRIADDPRHRSLHILGSSKVHERNFAAWSMAFADLGDPSLADVEGYSDLLSRSLDDPFYRSTPSRAKALMLTFRKAPGLKV